MTCVCAFWPLRPQPPQRQQRPLPRPRRRSSVHGAMGAARPSQPTPFNEKCVSFGKSPKTVENRIENRPFRLGISRKPEKPMARKKGGVNSFHGIPAFGNFPSQMAGFQAGFRRLSGIPWAKRTFSLKGVVVRGALPPCRPWASRVSA